MSDKELDNIFKSKLSSREFDFNPANWEAMEAILDSDKKRGSVYWWSSAAILVFGLFVSGLIFMQNPGNFNSVTPETITVTPDQEIMNNGTAISGGSETPDEIVKTQLTQPEPEKTMDVEEVISHTNPSITKSSVIKPKEDTPIKVSVAAAADKTEQEPAVKINPALESLKVNKQLDENEKPNDLTIDKSVNALNFGDIAYKDLPAVDYNLLDGLGVASLKTNKVRTDFIRKFHKQHEFWVQAGPDFTRSFKDNSIKTGWTAGLNYKYRFSYLWSFNVAAQYNARVFPGIKHTTDSVFRGFGEERIRTESENTRLDYIEVPFNFAYSPGDKHEFGFGAYASALFNVKTEITRTHFQFKKDKEVSYETQNGISEDYNVLDYGLNASYFYQYSPSIALGVQMKMGMADITRNRSQVLNADHRNRNLRLVLRYRLL